MVRRTLILSCVLLVASCGSRPPRGLWSDPALDSATLAEGIVVGGVVDLTAERDLFEMLQDAKLLEVRFARERPKLSVVPWSEARASMEVDSLDAVLAAYRLTGRLSAPQLRTLAPLAERGRYLALARIDLDQTLWYYDRRTRQSGDRTVVDIEPESRRTTSLIFDLYDLQEDRLVFTVPAERTGIEHGNTRTVEGADREPTESEIRDAVDDLDRGSDRPEPAERESLLDPMFKDVVKLLP